VNDSGVRHTEAADQPIEEILDKIRGSRADADQIPVSVNRPSRPGGFSRLPSSSDVKSRPQANELPSCAMIGTVRAACRDALARELLGDAIDLIAPQSHVAQHVVAQRVQLARGAPPAQRAQGHAREVSEVFKQDARGAA